jgi:hypothetical protein
MKTLDISPDRSDEAGYTIEDGIVVDIDSRPNARRAYDEWTRYWQPSAADRQAEEAAWAARSGPVYTIKEGKRTA